MRILRSHSAGPNRLSRSRYTPPIVGYQINELDADLAAFPPPVFRLGEVNNGTRETEEMRLFHIWNRSVQDSTLLECRSLFEKTK